MTLGNPRAAAVARVVLLIAVLLALPGCGDMISMDALAALVGSDITSVAAKIVVTQGATPLPSGSGQHNFAPVVADGMTGNFVGSSITFTITNSGGAKSTLTVNSVALSGANSADFTLSAPAATTLAYNASVTFTLTFDPGTIGGKTATVTVASTGSDTPSYTFTAAGTGVAFSIATVPIGAVSSFVMGYPGVTASNQTVASITAFNIGAYEVTYQEWLNVKTWATDLVLAHGYTFTGGNGVQGKDGSDTNPLQPVTTVNWRDAIVWCNAASELAGLTPVYYTSSAKTTIYKTATDTTSEIGKESSVTDTNACANFGANGYRLPTEAEWEYAARRTSTTPTQGDRVSGDSAGGLESTYAWYSANSTNTTHPAGGRTVNSQGIYDMSGNVHEWCWDWYAPYQANVGADNPGPIAGTLRTIRGGSYSNLAAEIATSYRTGFDIPPGTAVSQLGFRVVRR